MNGWHQGACVIQRFRYVQKTKQC